MKNKKKKIKKEEPLSANDILDFTLRKRQPRTEKEKTLQREIEEIEKRGNSVEIPFETF